MQAAGIAYERMLSSQSREAGKGVFAESTHRAATAVGYSSQSREAGKGVFATVLALMREAGAKTSQSREAGKGVFAARAPRWQPCRPCVSIP